MKSGPLAGLKVVELAGLGPAPHAAMILADLGADVVRIDRPAQVRGLRFGSEGQLDLGLRGRRTVQLDLREDSSRRELLDIVAHADVFIEGLRPGVAERLGIGPDDLLGRNGRLVYGRMTGWGQSGPRASSAGHDINYLALTGALNAMGHRDAPPTPPLNLVSDFGGGSMLLLVGILSALFERNTSGAGQVIDAAMVDGTVLNCHMIMALTAMGSWTEARESNLIDGGAPFYRVYPCADGKFIALGALEPQFYVLLLEGLGIDPAELGDQMDTARWPEMATQFANIISGRTRDEWAAHFAGSDACVTPVLTWSEAADDEHLRARQTWVKKEGVQQAAPAPRFSRTPGAMPPATPDLVYSGDVIASWTESASQ